MSLISMNVQLAERSFGENLDVTKSSHVGAGNFLLVKFDRVVLSIKEPNSLPSLDYVRLCCTLHCVEVTKYVFT